MSDYPVVRGQVWLWGPQEDPAERVKCLVTRVARDGSWADLRCRAWNGNQWSKRMRLPFPGSFELTDEYVVLS